MAPSPRQGVRRSIGRQLAGPAAQAAAKLFELLIEFEWQPQEHFPHHGDFRVGWWQFDRFVIDGLEREASITSCCQSLP